MISFVASLGAYTALFVLLVSGVHHIVTQERFKQLISAQRVWREGRERAIAVLVAVAETVVGGTGLVVVFWRASPRVSQLVLGTATVVFGIFASYGLFLARRRPGAPCACGFGDDTVSSATPFRALMLCIAALTGALGADYLMGRGNIQASEAMTMTAAVGTFATLSWALDGALFPSRKPPTGWAVLVDGEA